MVQSRQLNLPTQRDPLARLALIVLVACACWLALSAPSVPASAEAVLIATPTIGIMPTPQPTEAPVVAQAAPTFAPTSPPAPTAEPVVVEVPVVQIVEVTAMPVPTDIPPTEAPQPTPYPDGTLIILPTAQSNADFVASFGAPTQSATCAFTGCLHQP